MTAGAFNPLDNDRTVSERPAHILTGAGIRRYFSDLLRTRPHAQDFFFIIEQFRNAIDYFAIPDVEGDDTILRQLLLAVNMRRNFVCNPSFALWQAGASLSATYLADLWKTGGTAGRTFSRQAGFSGARYCMRAQRNLANATTAAVSVAHVVDPEIAYQLAGKTIVISADIRAGATFSGVSLGVIVAHGTGVDEMLDASTMAFTTGSINATLAGAYLPGTTAERRSFGPYTVPAGIGELGFRIAYSPVGVAGATDYFEVTNVKLEIASKATGFEPEPFAVTLATALRLYRKSFLAAAVPASNIGAGSGEYRFPATLAGAVTNRLGSVRFGAPMRAIPAVTLLNPAAANSEVRDLTATANCSASAAVNISDSGFEITCTGHASTVVGDDLGIHWTADARAF